MKCRYVTYGICNILLYSLKLYMSLVEHNLLNALREFSFWSGVMKKYSHRLAWVGSVVSSLMLLTGPASALTLDVYSGPTITDALKADTRACLNVGDAVSCSAGMLNVLTGRDATNQTDASQLSKWGFVLASPQGDLKNRIVVGTGGNAATDNGEIAPSAARIEDGFKTNNAGDIFAATGKSGTLAGNLADPANNSLNPKFDQAGTWDVEIGWLINALTIDGVRRELMIGFDYNQTKSDGTLDYWSLITVLDYKRDAAGNLVLDENGMAIIERQVNYEIKNFYGGYLPFMSTKTFDDQPAGGDFSTVNTKTCYKITNGSVTDVMPIATGQCPAGYETVNNAQGDNSSEILAFLPELNAGLEGFMENGFDSISVRMMFGCFDNNPLDRNGNPDKNYKGGIGYLSSGATANCDGGGNVDVYLLANMPNDTPPLPEPGTLALLGLGLAGLAWASRRRMI